LSVLLLVVVIIYLALYLASLVILKPIIGYWSNATAVAFRPIFNSAMLIIYLTSPFNAYEALILHYPPWLYFIYTVVTPAVVLALILVIVQRLCQVILVIVQRLCQVILVIVQRLCQVGMADCVTVGGLFLIHSFALALATSYITSLVTWFTLGKPGIGTSIYTEFTLASAIYVTLYSTTELLKRLRSLRCPLMRLVTLIVLLLSVSIVIIVSVAYSMFKLLPPTPPHLIGLVLTVTILTGYHVTRRKAEAR